MTVSSATSKVQYNGNGSTTVFAYTFKVFDQNDLTVIVRSAAGTETVKTITTHYTVSGVGSAGGGNVTMLTAPASGETLTILREQDLTQELDLVENDPFPSQSLENALDKLTFIVQQQSEELTRTIKAPRTNTVITTEFTVPADRANKVLAFDANGNVINGPTINNVTNAEAYATAAAASAATASAYTPAYFNNFTALKADTSSWPPGQLLNTRAEGFAYQVVTSGEHVTTTGGTKLIVLPGDVGYNVKAFGAVGDGVTNDTAAFLTAAVAAGASNPIYVPSGLYNKTTIANEDTYFWICGEAFNASGTNPISLLGHVEQALNNRRLISKTASSANEFAEVQLNKTFNYTGGTSGNVSSNLHLTTAVSQNVTNFVWGITSVLNNSADAGENVAIYGQGNRDAGVGPIWGGVFEAKDKTNTSGVGKGGTVGLEVDIFANDVVAGSLNRVGIDVVGGKGDPTGATCQVGYGVRVGPQGGSVSNATFIIGYSATGTTTADFSAGSAGTVAGFNVAGSPISGVRISGTCAVGLNTSTGTITSNAVRLASTQNIAMEATGVIKTSWGVTANIWGFYNGATEIFGINTLAGVLRVSGTQVIAARQTGWAAPTGTATRTTFATSTVTTAQLAERVKALIDDLTTHGLIGA